MNARTIIGAIALLALGAVAVYLLFQIPWEYGVGGVLVLGGLLWALGTDAPDALP
jgi:hypothetical protein